MASLLGLRGTVVSLWSVLGFKLKTHLSCCFLAAHTHRTWNLCPQTTDSSAYPVGIHLGDTADFRGSSRATSASFLCFQPIFAFCPRILPGDPLSPGVTQGQGGDACRGCLAFFPSPRGGAGEKGRRQTANAGARHRDAYWEGGAHRLSGTRNSSCAPAPPDLPSAAVTLGVSAHPSCGAAGQSARPLTGVPPCPGSLCCPCGSPPPPPESPHFPLCSGSALAGVWEQAPLPRGPVRRGPENNGGPRPPHWLGLGWAVFPVTSSLFTSFLRKGKLDRSQRPRFQAGLSVVLAPPRGGRQGQVGPQRPSPTPSLAGAMGPRCPRMAGLTTPPGPPVTRCSSDQLRGAGGARSPTALSRLTLTLSPCPRAILTTRVRAAHCRAGFPAPLLPLPPAPPPTAHPAACPHLCRPACRCPGRPGHLPPVHGGASLGSGPTSRVRARCCPRPLHPTGHQGPCPRALQDSHVASLARA